MPFLIREECYVGNSWESAIAKGYINNYIEANGYVEIANTWGTFESGQIVYGKDSEFSKRLSSDFVYKLLEPATYDDGDWLIQDDGAVIALDEHFTGFDSQDYQTTYVVIVE